MFIIALAGWPAALDDGFPLFLDMGELEVWTDGLDDGWIGWNGELMAAEAVQRNGREWMMMSVCIDLRAQVECHFLRSTNLSQKLHNLTGWAVARLEDIPRTARR